MRILLTGASGFVGSNLTDYLLQDATIDVVAASREAVDDRGGKLIACGGHQLTPETDWGSCLDGVEVVVHLAARVHVMRESVADPLGEFRRVNLDGTVRLAEQAAEAGVRRFVFVSSVKVNGEETPRNEPFSVDCMPRPVDAYGISKWEAEESLRNVSLRTGMEVVVLRLPLVYGPRVRGNFFALMRLIDRGWPLPLGAIDNKRSLVSIWNLCDLLKRVTDSPLAAGKTFMVADGDDLSTPDLVRHIATAMQRRVGLPRVPVGLLSLLGRLVGRRREVARLCDSLSVDITRTQNELMWKPPLSVEEGIARTVAWYLTEGRFLAD